MDIKYNPFEIFEIADEIEVAGEKFYRHAAAQLPEGDDVRALLTELADMELSHKSYFSSIREQYNIHEIEGLIDIESQQFAYLKAIGDAHVIHNLNEILSDINADTSAQKILQVAVEFEKDSVVYFAALKSALIDTKERDAIDKIIAEEGEHVGVLTRKLREIQGK